MVGAVVAWNLFWLYPQTRIVAYVNDSAMHEQMVRFAARSFSSGDLPAAHWYSYLNEGSPQFLHYQQLGAQIFGAFGALSNPTTVFHWSSYLLLALWPVAIYLSARILRLPPLAAACSAAISPFLVSVPGVGYEQKAYLWVGFGLWAQLCASWMLPFAWATIWRALDDRRWLFGAALASALTIGLHFETGYLTLMAILLLPLVKPNELRRRVVTAAMLFAGTLLGASWVIIPLLLNSKWAAINSYLSQTGLVRGYGARQDLLWLVQGRTFDDGRFAVVTLSVLAGLLLGCTLYRKLEAVRPVVSLFMASLLLSFGPTTWGAVTDLIPGHSDIFFRRFLIGVDLAGIYLAGLGLYLGGTAFVELLVLRHGWVSTRFSRALGPARTVLVVGLLVLVLVPAGAELAAYDQHNATLISRQAASESVAAPQIAPIISYLRSHPDGRVYAGSPSTGGDSFDVGFVPMYEYLTNFDIDVVGFTMRTASLMSQPENYFNPRNLSDYRIFGIRYVLVPRGRMPLVRARLALVSGGLALWVVPTVATSRSYVPTACSPRAGARSVTSHIACSTGISSPKGLTRRFDGRQTVSAIF